ncbi:MAG: 2-C-methyl-D-erythritol 4-phosphate cytidylyltransferase [Oscillospiraceae bacterium]|nr:2-C-methyl-D-erythritol 4-phosphate cytidylyltransferase [Oscillospiraceae bacterium]MDY6208706.1 2-C-methyl-D-erythritol 4-phosphate cytidylyltransferase [Oscillospiraceae bacterium]
MDRVSVIIAAGGRSQRMEGINKQLALLRGVPVIARSMMVFQELEEVGEIIISARPEDMETIDKFANEYGITKFAGCAEGGETRQQSVVNALKRVSRDTSLIAVHDGARPLVKAEFIRQCIRDASIFGGAALAVPVKDTIKQAEGGFVTDTPDRSRLFITQTPQIFKKKLYFDGVNFAGDHGLDFTDDCQLAEAVGGKIHLTISDYRNIKITTPEDMAIAEAILAALERKDNGV